MDRARGSGFWVNGLFESVSGFTTTGASILQDIEGHGPAILLWRSLTHWLGGMGIIVLGIAILPKLAVGGLELLGAEAPGPIKEKLTPRIAQTAKALWGIYALLTLVEIAALMLAGMGAFDAINHAFATMATGGFSTLNGSLAGFNSPLIEWIVIVFMVLAGANFALHFQLLRGRPKPLLKDREFHYYLSIMLLATVLICTDLVLRSQQEMGLIEAFRAAAFQSVAIVTTTGFATADFNAWPAFSRALIFLLMFVGGCAGSTGGSVKVVRIMIVMKKFVIDLKSKVQPHAVLPVRVGTTAVPDAVVNSVTTFLLLFVALFAIGGLLLTALGIDPATAFSASASCIANVGPGFAGVGPAQNYGDLPAAAKFILLGLMLIAGSNSIRFWYCCFCVVDAGVSEESDGIKQRIEDDIKQAMRDRNKEVVATLRMLKARFQEREVALRVRAREGLPTRRRRGDSGHDHLCETAPRFDR